MKTEREIDDEHGRQLRESKEFKEFMRVRKAGDGIVADYGITSDEFDEHMKEWRRAYDAAYEKLMKEECK